MNIEEFISKNRKRKSIFDEYKNDIIKMIKSEVSQENMIVWIKKKSKGKISKGLTQGNLSQYIKRLKTNNLTKSQEDFFQKEVTTSKEKNSTAGAVEKKSGVEKTTPLKQQIKTSADKPRITITHHAHPSAAEELGLY